CTNRLLTSDGPVPIGRQRLFSRSLPLAAAGSPRLRMLRQPARRLQLGVCCPPAHSACWPVPPTLEPAIMNRLSAAPALPHSSASAVASRERRSLRVAPRHDSPQCLLAPVHYERNYAYPLVVWLHAPGNDEREIKQIMP